MSNVNNILEDEDFSCPSFSSYSQNKTAEIANKVTSENPRYDAVSNIQEEEDDEDFEFSFYEDTAIEVNVSFKGQNQIFPVFNRHILLPDEVAGESQLPVPLFTLLDKEKSLLHHHGNRNKNNFDSCSSSEADELENIPSGTYCVWRPNKCKKSQSAGSASRRWASLRDLMRRSSSEGMALTKDSFVFLTPKKNKDEHRKAKETLTVTKDSSSSSAHEEFYVRNRAAKEGDKKKSYLPYRKELVGFFVNGNRFLPHV